MRRRESDPLLGNKSMRSGSNMSATSMIGSVFLLTALSLAIAALVIAIQNRPAGPPPTPARASPICQVRVSRASGRARVPVEKDCLRYPGYKLDGIEDRRHTEDESTVAVNPTNPNNIIVTSHQGLFQSWNADAIWFSKDGGQTWDQGSITTARCQGPTVVASESDYFTASDPVVVFGADGVAYYTGNNFNIGTDADPALTWKEGMPVFKSYDGGATWSTPTDVNVDDGIYHYDDRVILSPHPTNKSIIYMTWADYPCYSILGACGDETVRFRWSEDGGTTWKGSKEGNIVYYDRDAPNASSFGLPSSWYCPVFVHPISHKLIMICGQWGITYLVHQRLQIESSDGGLTWSSPRVISSIGTFDSVRAVFPLPNTQVRFPGDTVGTSLRTAVPINYDMNKQNGYLYGVGSTTATATGNSKTNVLIHMSKDGGATWTTPQLVNPDLTHVQSFLATVAVADDGTVGVAFYDDRHNIYSDASNYLLDVWLVLFDKDLNRIGETRITAKSFDMQASNLFSRGGPFLGDYQKLVADRNEFVGVFAATEAEYNNTLPMFPNGTYFVDDEDRQNIFVFRASASCGYTPSVVTHSRRHVMPKNTGVHGKKRTLTNLELARLVYGKRKGGKAANERAGPLYLQKFNVTLEQVLGNKK